MQTFNDFAIWIHTLSQSLLDNPLLYIGACLCVLATYGFTTFLRGFLSGSGYILLHDGHAEHQHHAQIDAMTGAFQITAAFIFWEILRFVATWFGYDTANTVVSILLIIFLAIWIIFFKSKASAGGGH